jgi:hypothetical protein
MGTLSGFSFTSSDGPGIVAFSTFDENFTEFDGRTTGPIAPTSIPEPGSWVLFSLGLAAFRFRFGK